VSSTRKARRIAGFSEEQAAALFREFVQRDTVDERNAAKDAAITIYTDNVVARAGQFLRVQPDASGMAVLLPNPDRTVPGDRVTISLEQPAGELAVLCIPTQVRRGRSTQGTVNGETRATFSTAGVIELISNGVDRWCTSSEFPEESPTTVAIQTVVAATEDPATVSFGVPGAVSLETAAAEGTASTAARSDHVHSTIAGTPVAIGSANAEGTSANFARADHVHSGFVVATGSQDGFISRRVYANASSAKVGTTFMGVTVLSAPASFTSMSDFADGGRFRIGIAAPGASGASGSRGTATVSSGSAGGGGGGAFRDFWMSRAELVTMLAAGNITVAVGLGGAAVTGASSSATSFTAPTQGNNGSGPTTFGPWSVYQGGGGNGGGASSSARAGGAGGGWTGAGGGGTTGTAATLGGGPQPLAAVQTPTADANTGLFSGGGCTAPNGTTGATGNPSLWGGAGGSSNGATSSSPRNGGESEFGAAGGACGGLGSNGSGGNGGDGGLAGGRTSRAAGGTASTGAGARTGGNGAPGAAATDVWHGLGDGGAGGGCGGSSNSTATGGNGGAGGFPGGGGGGGGTGTTQAAANTSTAGNSGAGGDGLLIIESYA
jgi:hypothetical protein